MVSLSFGYDAYVTEYGQAQAVEEFRGDVAGLLREVDEDLADEVAGFDDGATELLADDAGWSPEEACELLCNGWDYLGY